MAPANVHPQPGQPRIAASAGWCSVFLAALCAGSCFRLDAADLDSVQVHGFISQGYVRTNANGYYDPATSDGGSLDFREMALNVVAQPEDRLRLGIQIISQDMGRLYNNELAIDWAHAVFTQTIGDGQIQFRAGRIKTGHALYNNYRDLDLSRATVFLPECVYFNSWRKFYTAIDGVGLELRSPATALGSFDLGVIYGNQQIPADDPSLSVYGETVDSSRLERQWGVQATWRPVSDLLLKVSFLSFDNWNTTFAPADTTPPDAILSDASPYYREVVASTEYTNDAWQVAGEMIYWTSKGVTTYTGGTSAWTQAGIGGYAMATWEFHPRWKAAVVAQAHNMRTTDEWYGDGFDQTRAIGTAACYSVTGHWLVKAELQRIQGVYFLRGADQPTPYEYESRFWTMFALRTTFDF